MRALNTPNRHLDEARRPRVGLFRVCCVLLGFLAVSALVSCGTRTGTVIDNPPGNPDGGGGDNSNGGGDAGGGDGTGGDNSQQPSDDDSVSDVTTGNGSGGSSHPRPSSGVSARVRNESAVQADVTMRFVDEDTVVHLAFVRVLPDTMTTVTSPRVAERIELSGLDERGRALERRTLHFGVDFDAENPAEYVILPEDSDGPEDPPVDSEPPGITLVAPTSDISVALGTTLLVKWEDTNPGPGAVVQLFLRPEGSADSGEWVPLGPGVDAALDGLNDQLMVVLEGVETGTYEIVAEIRSGSETATSVAPGRVEIVADPANAAPTLTILSPTDLIELRNGESLRVQWVDDDADDNAVITFSLSGTGASGTPVGPFTISPPIAEDPDGDAADSVRLAISGMLPGLYDLVGTIDDGRLVGTDRVERVVRVVSDPVNTAPELTLLEPASDVEVPHGESFLVRWTDSDDNDNARIALTLDPFAAVGAPDRSPALLVSSLAEDPDGPGDEITLGIPAQVAKGTYRVKGEITDGTSTAVSWAPGIVYFGVSGASAPQVALTEPAVDVRTRLGETIDVQVDATGLPSEARVRLYLSNLNYGGETWREITPSSLPLGSVTGLALSDSPPVIPNEAWPRQFELHGEITVDGVVVASDVAAGTVWIRQEVEVTTVTVNYTCPSGDPISPNEREVSALEVQWYGGGFTEREAHAQVEFWLLPEVGEEPPLGAGDRQHRLFHTAPESPNVSRVVQIPLQRIFLIPVNIEDGLSVTMVPKDYFLRTRVQTPQFGSVVSSSFEDSVPVCGRIR